jgi:hypothetical protein
MIPNPAARGGWISRGSTLPGFTADTAREEMEATRQTQLRREASSQFPAPARSSDLMRAYEAARADENARSAFESRYRVTRITCTNLQDRKMQPQITLRFESHKQGWFLAVEQGQEIALLPGYVFEFQIEPERWKHMFTYPPNECTQYRVTKPGRLFRQGDEWLMEKGWEGEFGNG